MQADFVKNYESTLDFVKRKTLWDELKVLVSNPDLKNLKGESFFSYNTRFPSEITDSIVDKIDRKVVTSEGKIAKRIRKALKEEGIKIDDSTFSEFINRILPKTESGTIRIRYTPWSHPWKRGDYGDSESCFFSSRYAARYVIEQSRDTVAVLVETATVRGRFWLTMRIQDDTPIFIVWNIYRLDPLSIKEVLSILNGSPIYEIKTYSMNSEYFDPEKLVWVNNGKYIVFSENENVSVKNPNRLLYFDIVCVSCGDDCTESAIVDKFGDLYCADCKDHTECDDCGEMNWTDDMTGISSDHLVCEDCLEKYEYDSTAGCWYSEQEVIVCACCGETRGSWSTGMITDGFTRTEKEICDTCFDNEYFPVKDTDMFAHIELRHEEFDELLKAQVISLTSHPSLYYEVNLPRHSTMEELNRYYEYDGKVFIVNQVFDLIKGEEEKEETVC